jgi:CHASE3 domain sensor protein
MRAHARRRRGTVLAVTLLALLSTVVLHLVIELVATRRALEQLQAEHHDTREILTSVQEAYLTLRRELNELEAR